MKNCVESRCGATAQSAGRYVEEHLFDPEGFMMSAIDSSTGRPFEPDFITPIKVPRRADIDPWAFWTYEDSVMAMGLYMDALMRQHAVIGDARCVERCRSLWQTLRRIYSASQIHGIGSFLRPYGGWKGGLETLMHQFLEPLGTDQASPMLSGLYLFRPHADKATQTEIDTLVEQTLKWYADQGFTYFYYKTMLTEWNQDFQHGMSFFLPAAAWTARRTRSAFWRKKLDGQLARFRDPKFHILRAFNWGSDLPVLAELLGKDFARHLPMEFFDRAFAEAQIALSTYPKPEMIKRDQPGVTPDQVGVDPEFDRERGFGFAFFATRHRGRQRPHFEHNPICGLAALGYPGAFEMAFEILSLFKRVPEDFTHYLYEDYDHLPETVHLYARSTGVQEIQWLRNYWLLRQIEMKPPKQPWLRSSRRNAGHFTDFIRVFRVSEIEPYAEISSLAAPGKKMIHDFTHRKFGGAFADRHEELKQFGLPSGAYATGPFGATPGSGAQKPKDALVYYACRFNCARSSRLRAWLGYDGPVKVWVDGHEIFCDPEAGPPAAFDDAKVEFAASAGEHELVVALASLAGQAWGVFLRLEQRTPRSPLPELLES